jgi:hypothetical protein
VVKIEVTNEQAQTLRCGPQSNAENDPWRVLFRGLRESAFMRYGFGQAAEWVDSNGRLLASAHLG